MTKTIKVQYSTRYNGRRYSEVPKIQMEGKWLEAIGFSVGDNPTETDLIKHSDTVNIREEMFSGFLVLMKCFDQIRIHLHSGFIDSISHNGSICGKESLIILQNSFDCFK